MVTRVLRFLQAFTLVDISQKSQAGRLGDIITLRCQHLTPFFHQKMFSRDLDEFGYVFDLS